MSVRPKIKIYAAFCALALIAGVGTADAQQRGLNVVRDSEIEHIIRIYATPIFSAANLDPDAVSVHLINDRSLNAFVAGGQRLFLHTGLLIRAESASQVIGVIAHETGHIAGGHIARGEEAARNAYIESLIATVLGGAAVAAGAATGSASAPNAGAAVLSGGLQIATRSFLAFTRTQESSADQAAVTFLDQIGESSAGLAEFLKILGDQENTLAGKTDPYIRTHPISRERIDALSARIEQSRYRNAALPPEYVEFHARTQAKLIGFLEPLPTTLRRYPVSDTSLPARYARAIGYYRASQIEVALREINGLIAERPRDPFFQELKGQMLLENGRVSEAIPPYRQSVALKPHDPLLLHALGQALVATEDPAQMGQAITYLEESVNIDPGQSGAWYQLSICYGRLGRLGEAHVATAEQALLVNRPLEARQQAERAKGKLAPGSPAALRADDIIAAATRRLQEERR